MNDDDDDDDLKRCTSSDSDFGARWRVCAARERRPKHEPRPVRRLRFRRSGPTSESSRQRHTEKKD